MTKSLMISIRPKHLVNILNGNKTLELRKTVPKDFKGWVYIYCTKGKPYITETCNNYNNLCKFETFNMPHFGDYDLNGKVVARFWFDEYVTYEPDTYMFWHDGDDILKKLSLSWFDVSDYAGTGKLKPLYAWHIKKLEIFDKPMELRDFYKANLYTTGQVIKEYEKRTNDFKSYRLKRPPQSWQYIYTKEVEK